jgi:cytochrome c-type biogenesis protein CcmE
MKASKTKLIIGLFIIAGAIAYLIYTNFQTSFLYYFTVGEIAAKADELVGKRMRMAGRVGEGTLAHDRTSRTYLFSLTEGDDSIAVTYQGTIPDTFREGADAVVEGLLIEPAKFDADLVFAKCPSKYESEIEEKGNDQ